MFKRLLRNPEPSNTFKLQFRHLRNQILRVSHWQEFRTLNSSQTAVHPATRYVHRYPSCSLIFLIKRALAIPISAANVHPNVPIDAKARPVRVEGNGEQRSMADSLRVAREIRWNNGLAERSRGSQRLMAHEAARDALSVVSRVLFNNALATDT